MYPVDRTIPDFINNLMRNAPLSPEKLTFAWRTSVGPAIARVSTATLTADGTVHIQCANEQWRREIRRSLPMIKERLIGLLGAEVIRHVKLPAAPRTKKNSGMNGKERR